MAQDLSSVGKKAKVIGAGEWMEMVRIQTQNGLDATMHWLRNAVLVVAACRAVLAKHLLDDPGAHGWTVNTGAMQKGLAGMGSWQGRANQAWQGKAMQNRRFSTTGR